MNNKDKIEEHQLMKKGVVEKLKLNQHLWKSKCISHAHDIVSEWKQQDSNL